MDVLGNYAIGAICIIAALWLIVRLVGIFTEKL